MTRRPNFLAFRRERRRIGTFKPKPVRDPQYLAWIRTLPCIVCFPKLLTMLALGQFDTHARSEVAHSGPHGLSQKASDLTAIPLCPKHHREGPDAYHTLGKRFFRYHQLDRDEILTELNSRYPAWRKAA